jgi:hypothetical protein
VPDWLITMFQGCIVAGLLILFAVPSCVTAILKSLGEISTGDYAITSEF